MEPHCSTSITSIISLDSPESLRHKYIRKLLENKAVELQSRQNRHDSKWISNLMSELLEIKFECLNASNKIKDLFVSVSQRAEMCEQQIEFYSETDSRRKQKKMRESFGFSQFQDEDIIDGVSDDDDDEPEYIKDFGANSNSFYQKTVRVEQDGLEMRKEFNQIDYTSLQSREFFTDRVIVVEK